jgi:hypothetical protein
MGETGEINLFSHITNYRKGAQVFSPAIIFHQAQHFLDGLFQSHVRHTAL